jgi:hypothetical protein
MSSWRGHEHERCVAELKTMRALPTWNKVHEAVDGFAASLKGKSFVTIGA